MIDRATREYLLKQSPAALVEILEGKLLRLRSCERRMKAARRHLTVESLSYARACLDLRRRKDLDE